MKKLKVEESTCIGCGACSAIDPTHFEMNDGNISTVITQNDLDSNSVNEAIDSCPVGAISLEDCNCENCDCKKEA